MLVVLCCLLLAACCWSEFPEPLLARGVSVPLVCTLQPNPTQQLLQLSTTRPGPHGDGHIVPDEETTGAPDTPHMTPMVHCRCCRAVRLSAIICTRPHMTLPNDSCRRLVMVLACGQGKPSGTAVNFAVLHRDCTGRAISNSWVAGHETSG